MDRPPERGPEAASAPPSQPGQTPNFEAAMKAGRVAVAGLGGLGSNAAVMLARTGVGTLLLVDFDTVSRGNLNRQHYTARHLGMPKTDALAMQIKEINPSVEIQTRNIRLTAGNASEVFAGFPIVVEALDDAVCKAELAGALLAQSGVKVVAASGIAGYGSANGIRTVKRLGNLYICGDMSSEAGADLPPLAPRVMICAGHQANMVVRLLMGQTNI